MTEMDILIAELEKANIPHGVIKHLNGTPQVLYPDITDPLDAIADAICFPGSYGGDEGFIEIMAPEEYAEEQGWGDTCIGWLTGLDAARHFIKIHQIFGEKG